LSATTKQYGFSGSDVNHGSRDRQTIGLPPFYGPLMALILSKLRLLINSHWLESGVLVVVVAMLLALVMVTAFRGHGGVPVPTGTVSTPTPSDGAPVLQTIGNKTVSQGSLLEFTVVASDPDGDTLLFFASHLPPGAVFDGLSRRFSWLPESAGTSTNITFSVTDGKEIASEAITITVNRVVPGLIGERPEGFAPLAMLFYGSHTVDVDALITSVRPQFAVVNTSHGMWGEISQRDLFLNTAAYKAAGIKVVGYITAGYEGAGSNGSIDPKWYSLETNQTLIKNMAEIDLVDGVFIDECSAFPDQRSKNYLTTLTDLAHSYGLITWGNVGQAHFDSWFFTGGGFDLMHSNEDWRGQSLTAVQRDWGYRISVSGEKPTYTAQDAFDLTVKAWESGLAYCYITDFGYASVPSWFDEYADLLKPRESGIGAI
jgi:hypothetical protein